MPLLKKERKNLQPGNFQSGRGATWYSSEYCVRIVCSATISCFSGNGVNFSGKTQSAPVPTLFWLFLTSYFWIFPDHTALKYVCKM